MLPHLMFDPSIVKSFPDTDPVERLALVAIEADLRRPLRSTIMALVSWRPSLPPDVIEHCLFEFRPFLDSVTLFTQADGISPARRYIANKGECDEATITLIENYRVLIATSGGNLERAIIHTDGHYEFAMSHPAITPVECAKLHESMIGLFADYYQIRADNLQQVIGVDYRQ